MTKNIFLPLVLKLSNLARKSKKYFLVVVMTSGDGGVVYFVVMVF